MAVSHQKLRGRIARKRFHNLLGCQVLGRKFLHVEADDSSTIVRHDDKTNMLIPSSALESATLWLLSLRDPSSFCLNTAWPGNVWERPVAAVGPDSQEPAPADRVALV